MMLERELRQYIATGSIEEIVLHGTRGGWELEARPDLPESPSSYLATVRGTGRVFRDLNAAINLVRDMGWTRAVLAEGMAS